MSIHKWEACVHSKQEHKPVKLPPGTPGEGGAYEHGLNTYDYLATTKNLKPYGESDYPTLNSWADQFLEEYPVQVTPPLSKFHKVSRRYRIWRPPEEIKRENEEYRRRIMLKDKERADEFDAKLKAMGIDPLTIKYEGPVPSFCDNFNSKLPKNVQTVIGLERLRRLF